MELPGELSTENPAHAQTIYQVIVRDRFYRLLWPCESGTRHQNCKRRYLLLYSNSINTINDIILLILVVRVDTRKGAKHGAGLFSLIRAVLLQHKKSWRFVSQRCMR